MYQDIAKYEYIPAIFWMGHLVVATLGTLILRQRAGTIAPTRRLAYFVVGGLLILAGLFPAALASMFTVGLTLGALAIVKAPTGIPLALALASPVGLLSAFLVVYLIVRATTFAFVRMGMPGNEAATS